MRTIFLLLVLWYASFQQTLWASPTMAHENMVVGLMYTGNISAADLERMILKLRYDFNLPTRALYSYTTIDTPGFYQLADNVANQITISASDVTFDMNGCTVSGGANGIVVNSGLNNVTIKNGIVTNVTTNAIQIGSGCSNITLDSITAKQSSRGIFFDQVTNGMITNCDMVLNSTGLELSICHNIIVEKCLALANLAVGFALVTSTTCALFDCKALSTGQGNSALFGNIYAFLNNGGNGNIYERCVANSTQALSFTSSQSIVAGFALLGTGTQCHKIIECEAGNATSSPNGYTMPYGILLQGSISSTSSITGALGTGGQVMAIDWSGDGQYLAVGGNVLTGGSGNGNELQIFRFDRSLGALIAITGALREANRVNSVNWSGDGRYLAASVGGLTGNQLQIFSFDRLSGVLTSIAGALGTGSVYSVSWSGDGQYLAVSGDILSGGNELQMFKFDRSSDMLTSITGALGTVGAAYAMDFSEDGQYVAVGGQGLSGNELQIFRFDRPSGSLTSITGALGTVGQVFSIDWSEDGQYVAVGGQGLSGNLQIFSFDRSSGSLTAIISALVAPSVVGSVNWSDDGQYIVVGGSGLTGGTGELQIFRFNRSSSSLTFVVGALGSGSAINSVSWSPDGQYIGVGGDTLTGNNALQILTGLQFPTGNVIMNNTVYCNSGGLFPSGVGISGSSIGNMMIGNTAYSNPVTRGANAPIVPSNYYFVTNVFNQLFGDAPTGLQNIESNINVPILDGIDLPNQLLRLQLLAQSLVDGLL